MMYERDWMGQGSNKARYIITKWYKMQTSLQIHHDLRR